jgi:4-amino-4-deoxy-L-arabinose transferase-like glycosyltransferase
VSKRSRRPPKTPNEAAPGASSPALSSTPPFWNARRTVLAIVLLLTVHLSLAVRSLVRENPTVDEVIHLPAGITYWEKGSFRLYHHNPPLVKLVAALPVVATGDYQVNYTAPGWGPLPNKAAFAHDFALLNAKGYLELFSRARLVMPLFSVLGGLAVFAWSRRLFGNGAGLFSLLLWALCPNVLAHCRLVTTDMGAAAVGVLATYVFWLYLQRPTWRWTLLAGLCLGLAQLTKFSLILLFGLWPLLGLIQLVADPDRSGLGRRLLRGIAQGGVMLLVCVLVIDVGYAFEGVGIPLGRFEFVSKTLTTDVPRGMWRPKRGEPLLDRIAEFRVNRFRGTALERLPVPLPEHYVLGFDDQKMEAEGLPEKFFNPDGGDEIQGYPVYLDGELRQKSWWYYYLLCLVYKVPEGTWVLGLAALVAAVLSPRARARWFDELTVLIIPVVVVFVMSVFTNINLGLRYVLPIFPYVYIALGRLVPWAAGFKDVGRRRLAWAFVAASTTATVAASLSVSPHFLAYFNWASGGPANGSRHLIDSNLDWGQDLVGLRRWIARHAPGELVGLAYFGQINPRIFEMRAEGPIPWFLPPPRPGSMNETDIPKIYRDRMEGLNFQPGLYAVSASLVRGLPWRVYDGDPNRWAPRSAWMDAFSYFGEIEPFAQIGYSIFLYRVTPEQARRLSRHWAKGAVKARPD